MNAVVNTTLVGESPSLLSRSVAVAGAMAFRPVADRLPLDGPVLAGVRLLVDGIGMIAPPSRTHRRMIRYGSREALWVQAPGASAERGVILYLHGGGFVVGSSVAYRALASRLSRDSGAVVIVPNYPKAPESRFPVAANDVLAWYMDLIQEGHSTEKLILAGDSAGAHLAAGVLTELKRDDMPCGVVMFSPLLDLRMTDAEARARRRRDPLSAVALGRRAVAAYVTDEDHTDRRVDVLATDHSHWPPTLIQVGGREMLLEDARALSERLDDGSVHHELQIWRGQVHAFQLMSFITPEARHALRHAAEFISDRLDAAAPNMLVA